MSKDKMVDEYLKGNSSFSALYRKATEGEQCPDEVAATIHAGAKRWSRLRLANSIAERLQREIRSCYERHTLLVGTVLPVLAAAALVLAFQMLAGNDANTAVDCPAPRAAEQSLNQSSQTPEPEQWLDQIR